jgi:hypothetical protein
VAKAGFPRWAIALIVGGVALFGALAAAVVWLGVSSGTPPTEEWVLYTAPDKQFTAMFPHQPTVTTQDVGNGVMVTFTLCRSRSDHWEISWAELRHDEYFDFSAALQAGAQEVGGKLTSSEPREFRGMRGMYGEVDNGRFKIQLFRTPFRVWTVAVRDNPELFGYFLENVRLSDEAMGIQPMKLEVGKGIEVFEDTQTLSIPGVVQGGRMPYTWRVYGDMPAGMKQSFEDGYMVPYQELRYEGNTGKAGTYEFSVTVTDADGRKASGKGSIIVKAMPDSIVTLVGETYLHDRQADLRATRFGTTITVPAGIRMSGCFRFEHADTLVLSRMDFTYGDMPTWLGWTNERWTFEGVPSEPGEESFTVNAASKMQGSARVYTSSLTFAIKVVACPDAEQPARVGEVTPTELWTNLQPCWRKVEFKQKRPENWNPARAWSVSGSWSFDVDEVARKLPPGLTLKIDDILPSDGYYGRGPLPNVYISGAATEAGTWTIELTATLHVKFIEQPFEITQKITIVVE